MNINSVNSFSNFEFDLELKEESKYGFFTREYFFKKNWNLLWYIKVNFLDREKDDNIARIIDTTSSSWFYYMTDYMKSIYIKNGYKSKYSISWVAVFFLEYVLTDIKKTFNNNDCLILVSSINWREKYLSKVIDSVKEKISNLIKEVWWWSEVCSFTIKI